MIASSTMLSITYDIIRSCLHVDSFRWSLRLVKLLRGEADVSNDVTPIEDQVCYIVNLVTAHRFARDTKTMTSFPLKGRPERVRNSAMVPVMHLQEVSQLDWVSGMTEITTLLQCQTLEAVVPEPLSAPVYGLNKSILVIWSCCDSTNRACWCKQGCTYYIIQGVSLCLLLNIHYDYVGNMGRGNSQLSP